MVSISKIAILLSLLLTTFFSLILKGIEDGVVSLEVEKGISFSHSRVHIAVINSMVLKNLTVHCKDKYHDLGTHILNYQDTYNFSFRPSFFWKVTLYFCRFVWEGEIHYFDIYKQNRDECVQCVWNIFKNGPCKMYPRYNKCYA